jgi:hypothetical protein
MARRPKVVQKTVKGAIKQGSTGPNGQYGKPVAGPRVTGGLGKTSGKTGGGFKQKGGF